MTFIKRHFAYQNPRFGRSAVQKSLSPYRNSVYYFWWEFLRRSDNYRKCCELGGGGKLKEIYQDFGDVFSVDFKTWWQVNDKGAELFAEQLETEFKIVNESDLFINSDKVIYLQVPLNLPKRHLMKEFQNVLNRNHEGRRGIKTTRNSTALYPIAGHVDISALDKCLTVYDKKIEFPKMPLWQIAQECKVSLLDNFILNDGSETPKVITDKKLVLSNTASRLIRRARKIIENVEKGVFPKSE